MSDMVHLLESFRGEADVERCSVTEAELVAMKEEKKVLEKNFSELDGRATELAKDNLAFLTQVIFILYCDFT